MVQVIQGTPSFGGKLGRSLGTGLGSGISSGIESLLEQKLKGLERQRQKEAFQQANIPEPIAQLLSSLDPSVQKTFIDRLQGLEVGGSPQKPTPPLPLEDPRIPEKESGLLPPQLEEPQEAGILPPKQEIPKVTLGPGSAERRHKEQLEAKKAIATEKREIDLEKEYSKKLDTAIEDQKNSSQRLKTLDKMLNLNESDKLSHPLTVSLFRKLDLEWALSPESQEYAALEKDFLHDLKSIFGSRITEREMITFLRSIPSLANNKEGRARIAHNLKDIYKAKSIYSHSLQEVLRDKENRKLSPIDLSFKVNDLAQERLNKIEKKLSKNLTTSFDQEDDIPENAIVEDDKGKKLVKRNGVLVAHTPKV